MSLKNLATKAIILLIVFCNAGCDQISKHIVRQKINPSEQIEFFSSHFVITKVENTGAFLSLGSNIPSFFKSIFLVIIPLCFLFGALLYLLTKRNIKPVYITAICFIIGGGLGNMYDRVLYGSVTDFFHIDFFLFKTGIFNMADVSIMTGFFILALNAFIKFMRKPTPETAL